MSERYHPNSDQVAFADSVGKSLLSILPLSRLHEAHEESSQRWADLQSLGVFDIPTSGLGAAEEALIALELGRRVVAPSVLATMGATHLLAAANNLPAPAAHAAHTDGRVASGYVRGDRVVYVEDSAASLLLVRQPAGARLCAYPKPSRTIDAQLWSSRLLTAPIPAAALAEATPAQALRLRLIDAAVLAGLARAALDMAVAYAGLREQFGRPIGTFQAVKHQCADMALAARCAGDQVSFAAVALDDAPSRDDAALQVESAFYVAGSAAIDNCGKNIQIHGGIGFSDEADPHHLLKRARVLVDIAGGLEAALTRIASCPLHTEKS